MSDVNDETKAAIEELRLMVYRGPVRLANWAATLRDWIDAEPARLAAAREEQREACVRIAARAMLNSQIAGLPEAFSEGQRTLGLALSDMPLTSTPLADRIAELEADQHCPTCGSSVYTCVDCDVAPLRAERDAWRAKAIRDPSQLAEMLWSECYADLAVANAQNIAERDALRAQVEAARAACDALRSDRYGADSVRWSAATEVLRAMDEAKTS